MKRHVSRNYFLRLRSHVAVLKLKIICVIESPLQFTNLKLNCITKKYDKHMATSNCGGCPTVLLSPTGIILFAQVYINKRLYLYIALFLNKLWNLFIKNVTLFKRNFASPNSNINLAKIKMHFNSEHQ